MRVLAALLLCGVFGATRAGSYCVAKGKNIAPEGKASQISVYHAYGNALNAIDGNRDGTYSRKSCILTRSENIPWWRVDLHTPRKVGAVVVVNRNDSGWNRLLGAEVRVGNEPRNQNPVCGTISEVEPGSVTTLCCDGMVGRYVSVVIPDRDDILNLCEVEIYPEGTQKPCV
ncbi:fucolectin-1-like [Pseudophryne corroboree]|uniref:fucolectin-1-like n=1 Tax=Pseudophryne corroboree TaxID=495146 RepID=UPI00308170E2